MLYDRGHNPSFHGGVLSMFGSEVVLEGDADRDQGQLLNLLSELRQQADYGYEPVEEAIDDLLPRAREFVAEMESLLQ